MPTFDPAIPDPDELVTTVVALATNRTSAIHGEQHWQTVAAFGIMLARETTGADPRLALLFGILHDCLRVHDGYDPDHGRRAGALARAMNGGSLFQLEAARCEALVTALSLHVDGLTSDDPTIGVCWDADRLHLWRIGVEPDPELLSTAAGRSRIGWAEAQVRSWRSWREIWALAAFDD